MFHICRNKSRVMVKPECRIPEQQQPRSDQEKKKKENAAGLSSGWRAGLAQRRA